MAADPRHRLGLHVGHLGQERHRRHEIVGAQAHLHGAAGIGSGGDGATQRKDMDLGFAHHFIFSDLKKRSASVPVVLAAGPMKASDTNRRPLNSTRWRSALPPFSGPVESAAGLPATVRQSTLLHFPPSRTLALSSR